MTHDHGFTTAAADHPIGGDHNKYIKNTLWY